MGRADYLKAKIDEDGLEERNPLIIVSSGDEANEDLSLKIVEKSLKKRAKLAKNDNQDVVFLPDNGIAANGVSSSRDAEEVSKKKRKKKKKVRKSETGDQFDDGSKEEDKAVGQEDASLKEQEKAGGQEKLENSEAVQDGVGVDENVDPASVQTPDNMVLRKLLRGRRYFDPPGSGWQSCYNCGEDGHMAVNCPSFQQKKRPCFLCGSLEHGFRQCSKERVCSICKTPGHRPKKCPEKHKSGPLPSNVCLKCGDSGHDMFSCEHSYALDDLKEIQCYICKSFGHLCCVNIFNSPKEASCYKCGQLGHTGLECSSLHDEAINTDSPNTSCYRCGEGGHFARECTNPVKASLRAEVTTGASSSTCYRCGEEGHFARECTSSVKAGKSNNEFSTPSSKPRREKKGALEVKSAPEPGKRRRRKTESEERSFMTPQKQKQRGGWIKEDPEDISQSRRKKNRWNSPSTPYMDHNTDFNFMPDGQASGSQYNGYSHMSNSQSGKRMRVNGEVHHSNNWRFPEVDHRNNWGNGEIQHRNEWRHGEVQHNNNWGHGEVRHRNDWGHGSNIGYQYPRYNTNWSNGGYRGNYGW
ncbi:zinc knuckle (CCHC-type) family protein [Euphorbia peplus]|nr:zinc knuckle (CCHC-type) family protein [Euphorbia peplus]